MNISPISFKGLITVTTRKDKDNVETERFRTTKKQDGEILAAFDQNQRKIQDQISYERYSENKIGYAYMNRVFGHQTTLFHKTLESIIGKKIPQPSLNNNKNLYIGGFSKNDYDHSRHDTSYNKIFYRDDAGIKTPSSSVVVDLMSPEERREAAFDSCKDIKNKLFEMTAYSDSRIGLENASVQSQKAFDKKHHEDYAKVESNLNKVLEKLEGHMDGPDHMDKAPKFNSKTEAYNTLVNKINVYLGIKPAEKVPEEGDISLSVKNIDNIKRAIYVLDVLTK